MWTQLCLILSILLPTLTHITEILRVQVVRSPQKRVETKLQLSTYTQPPFVSMRPASAESYAYTRDKKLQRVALGLMVFIEECDDFCRKIWLFLQEHFSS